ncbi:MAG: hypothetical protein IT373_35035 [Polyangiaceae bacterium]|nr:hypothetical protein [Polyangiaceae bacterium]
MASVGVVALAGAVTAVVLATRSATGGGPSGTPTGTTSAGAGAHASGTATPPSSPSSAASAVAPSAVRVPLRDLTPPELERRIVAAGWPIDPKLVLPGASPVLKVDTYSLSRDTEPDMAIVQLYRGDALQIGAIEVSMQGTGYLTAREGDRMLAVLVVGDVAATRALLAALR